MKIRSLTMGCCALGCCAMLAAGCQKGAATPEDSSEKTPQDVVATQVALRTWPRTVMLQGNLMGDEQAVVGTEVAGQVRTVNVDIGTQVAQGEVIAELDPVDFDLRVAEAQSQLAQARARLGLSPESDEASLDPLKAPPVVEAKALWEEATALLQRVRSLKQTDAVSDEEIQVRETAELVAKARYDSALNAVREQIAALAMHRALLDLATQAQANAKIKAPFSGVVAARQASPGVYLQVGAPVVTLVRIDPLRFRAGAPEREARSIKVGQAATLRIEGQGEPRQAKVSRISPVLDLASRSLVIEIDVPNPAGAVGGALEGGLFAECEVVVDEEARTLAAPATAIVEFAGVQKAWIIEDGKTESRRIVTGRSQAGWVEVLEGLGENETIVLDASRIAPGAVNVVQTSSPTSEISVAGAASPSRAVKAKD
jgi:RND family efflux transporter MFP subunit